MPLRRVREGGAVTQADKGYSPRHSPWPTANAEQSAAPPLKEADSSGDLSVSVNVSYHTELSP